MRNKYYKQIELEMSCVAITVASLEKYKSNLETILDKLAKDLNGCYTTGEIREVQERMKLAVKHIKNIDESLSQINQGTYQNK